MCGFVTYLGSRPEENHPRVAERAGKLTHRGPDDCDSKRLGGAVLAHERLSIVDVEGGRQPLVDAKGEWMLVCNGEIYNHQEIRDELHGQYAFKTRTDSEVILPLVRNKGADCVHRLDGMFAFVVTNGREALAARDQFGIKPLYMGHDAEGGLWFASELKSISDLCADVREFPAGHVWTSQGGFKRFYRPDWEELPKKFNKVVPKEIATCLERSVVKRLMSDVPLGVFLSGGLDSSLIAALVRKHVEELHSFSVGVEGSPDLAAAREVSAHLGTHHHECVYTVEEVVEALDHVIYTLESYDAALLRSSIPCYFLSRLAAQHVKVVLSGEGSDEAFAGYLYFDESKSPEALHRECVRILKGLHNMNLQRVDRMTMAHSLEARVPFLDTEFLDLVMRIDPAIKMHTEEHREKWLLRHAFEGILPPSILWRQKQEFAQGAGSERSLEAWFDKRISDSEFQKERSRFAHDPPRSKEELAYRRIFERHFGGTAAQKTVGRWRGSWAPEAAA